MTDRRPTEFELAIDGSVLRQPVARWIAVAGMLVIIVLSLLQLLLLADYGRPIAAVVVGALGIGLVISAIPRARDPLDRPPRARALVHGGRRIPLGRRGRRGPHLVPSPSGSAASPPRRSPSCSPSPSSRRRQGLGLLAILLLLRDEFNGIRDGFVYGALIGLGYTWYATAQSVGDTFARTGDANWLYEFLTHYPCSG